MHSFSGTCNSLKQESRALVKIITSVIIFQGSLVFSMNQYIINSPAEIIKNNILNPEFIYNNLLQFRNFQLEVFRETNNNNLFHSAIDALIKHKNLTDDYKTLVKECKPFLMLLKDAGVSLHVYNNAQKTPLSLVYSQQSDDPLKEFFETELL